MGNNGYTIADMIEPSICEMVSVHSPEETKANARLIAAAPELLEALERLLGAIATAEHLNEIPPGTFPETSSVARAAIAKAKGQP